MAGLDAVCPGRACRFAVRHAVVVSVFVLFAGQSVVSESTVAASMRPPFRKSRVLLLRMHASVLPLSGEKLRGVHQGRRGLCQPGEFQPVHASVPGA